MTATPTLSPLDRVLDRLDDVQLVQGKRGAYYRTAVCPLPHTEDAEDKRLSVHEGKDGRVSLFCEAGHPLADVLIALGLQRSDLYPERDDELQPPDDAEGVAPLPPPVCALNAPPAEPLVWAVEDVMIAGEIALFVGDGGSFKSTAALSTVAAMAGGYNVWGQFRTVRRPTLVVSAEDAASVVQMRLEALVAGAGWDRTRVLENVHYFASPDITLSDVRWQAHLAATARHLDAGMIVLDPLADLIDGEENSNSELRPLIKLARALGASTGAAVIIVHHAGKMSDGKRQIDRIRGGSALNAGARSILFFDYHQTGVTVEHLKMSRAPKLPTFVLSREIVADPSNRAFWTSAALRYQDARAVKMNQAERIVVEYVSNLRGATSTQVREYGSKNGFSREEISAAIATLSSRGVLAYDGGESGKAKRWRVQKVEVGLARDIGQNPATLPDNGATSPRQGLDPALSLLTNSEGKPLKGFSTNQDLKRSSARAKPNGNGAHPPEPPDDFWDREPEGDE